MARKAKAEKKAPKTEEPKRKRGRQTTYNEAKVCEILERFADGERLRHICKELEVPPGTFLGWVADNREGIAERYTRAHRMNALAIAEECFEIADDGSADWVERKNRDGSTYLDLNREHVRRSELKLKWRQWYIEKVLDKTLRPNAPDEQKDDNSTIPAAEAIKALERIAGEKAATAKNANSRSE